MPDEYIPLEDLKQHQQRERLRQRTQSIKEGVKKAGHVAGNVLQATGRGLSVVGKGLYKGAQRVSDTKNKSGLGFHKEGFGTKNFGINIGGANMFDYKAPPKSGAPIFGFPYGKPMAPQQPSKPKNKTRTVYKYIQVVKIKKRR